MIERLGIAFILTVLMATGAHGQRLPEVPERVAPPPSNGIPRAEIAERNTRVLHSTVIGAGYATGGVLAGLYVTSKLQCGYNSNAMVDTCAEKDFAGAFIGGALLGALGTHIGNRFRGNLAATTATGLGVAAAGTFAYLATHDGDVASPTALLGLAAMVAVEQATSRPRPPAPSRGAIAGIPRWELANEVKPRYASLYGLGGMMLGGMGGLMAGAFTGYRIAYPRDIQDGCEDCGFGGLIIGGLIGGAVGTIAGGLIGGRVGHGIDVEEAAARILNRLASH